jgi:hypothetical protein
MTGVEIGPFRITPEQLLEHGAHEGLTQFFASQVTHLVVASANRRQGRAR